MAGPTPWTDGSKLWSLVIACLSLVSLFAGLVLMFAVSCSDKGVLP